MRSLQKLMLAIFFIGITGLSHAQKSETQMYWIHEDRVKPSKAMEYEAIAKEMVSAVNKHGITDLNYLTMATSDYRYIYIGKLDNMAELDQNPMASLMEKMGEEAFNDMFDRMDRCYTDHVNYTLVMDKSLSYMPDGITITPAGQNYRENTTYYIPPKNMKKAYELAKKFKVFFEKIGSNQHYRVYRSGFGSEGTYYLVAIAAESPVAYEQTRLETIGKMGEEGGKLFAEWMSLVTKVETISGYMRPDLAVMAEKK